MTIESNRELLALEPKNTNLLQASLEKMIDSGILTDYTSATSSADIEGALQKMTVKSSVEELAKLRTSNDKKQQAQPEINKERTVKYKTDEQEEPVVAE